jgi:putative membrane protein
MFETMKNISFPHVLVLVLVPLMIWSGIDPVSRATWWAEIIPVSIVFLGFVCTFRTFRFSNLAYAFAFVWLLMHTIGAHYTFERVPFDWFGSLFGFERNHYDRIAHFAIGFYAFPIAELVIRTKFIVRKSAVFLFGLFAIMSMAASYELIEMWYAIGFGGEQASDFLGSQGDIWDAQKDILADTLGALFSLSVFPWRRY